MKVYVVVDAYWQEDHRIFGVFDNMEKALHFAHRSRKRNVARTFEVELNSDEFIDYGIDSECYLEDELGLESGILIVNRKMIDTKGWD